MCLSVKENYTTLVQYLRACPSRAHYGTILKGLAHCLVSLVRKWLALKNTLAYISLALISDQKCLYNTGTAFTTTLHINCILRMGPISLMFVGKARGLNPRVEHLKGTSLG